MTDRDLKQVFHNASAETRYFQKLGVDPTGFLVGLPSSVYTSPSLKAWPTQPPGLGNESSGPAPTIFVQDTQSLYCGWSEPSIKQINLGKACAALGLDEVEVDKLHNAGNDAFATLRVWETLLELEGQQSVAESEGAEAVISEDASKPSATLAKQAGSYLEQTLPANAKSADRETGGPAAVVAHETSSMENSTSSLVDLDPLFADLLCLSRQPRTVPAVATYSDRPIPFQHCPVGNLIDL